MNIIYVLYLLTIIIVFYNYNMINKPCYNKDNFQLLNRSSCNFLKNTLFGNTGDTGNTGNTGNKPGTNINSKTPYIYNSYDLVSDKQQQIESTGVYYWAFSCISQDMYINTIEINISRITQNVNIQIGIFSRQTNNITDTTEFETIKIIDKKYTLTTNGYISLLFDTLYISKPKEGSCYYLGLKIINTGDFYLWCKQLIDNNNNPYISLYRDCDSKNSLTDICKDNKNEKTKISGIFWIPYIQVYHN
jgi:hypothetical protein